MLNKDEDVIINSGITGLWHRSTNEPDKPMDNLLVKETTSKGSVLKFSPIKESHSRPAPEFIIGGQHCDMNPFYKSQVLTLRKVIILFADLTISSIMPIVVSFAFAFFLFYYLQQQFDHIRVRENGAIEGFVYGIIVLLWNSIAAFLSKMKLYKAQFLLSRFFSVVVLIRVIFFEYQWFITPGTSCRFAFSHFTLIIILWNFFWFGIVVFYCPVPQRIANYYGIFATSQMGFFVLVRFTTYGLRMFLLVMSTWDVLITWLPRFTPNAFEFKRGFYYSNFVKENKKFSFASNASKPESVVSKLTTETSEENYNNERVFSNIKQSKGTSKESRSRFILPIRKKELNRIEETENMAGFISEENYGPDALHRVQISCKQQINQGVHMDILTIFFYQCILIDTSMRKSMVATFVSFQCFAFFFMINEFNRLFHDKLYPIKFIVFCISEVFMIIIQYMVSPCMKHIALSDYFSVKLMASQID